MRIGVDASALLVRQKTGIQTYTAALVTALVEELHSRPDMQLFLYFHTGNRYAAPELLKVYRAQLEGAKLRTWPGRRWYRPALSAMAALDRLQLMHFPAPNYMQYPACPMVATVHDLAWVGLPEEIAVAERTVVQPVVEQMIRRAVAFIAVSESTRADLLRAYRIPAEKVWTAVEGAGPLFRPNAQAASAACRKYGLGSYILYVGTLQQRKNLLRLIEAYARLAAAGCSQDLVLAGSQGNGYPEVAQAVERLGLQERVRCLGYVPEEDLPGLYSGADLFVYPSLYEGFGLPVLEAMACGAPVAVARATSLPEVAGAAGLYFDPYDVDEISRTLASALDDPASRAALRQRSLQQAQRFTWQEAARQTVQVYLAVRGRTARGIGE